MAVDCRIQGHSCATLLTNDNHALIFQVWKEDMVSDPEDERGVM